MIVLIAMWATVLSQNMCTPYLAVIAPAHSSSKEQGGRGSWRSLLVLPFTPQLSEAGASALCPNCRSSAFCVQITFLFFSFELKVYHGWNQSQGYDFLPSCWILLDCRAGGLTQTAEDTGMTPLLGHLLPCQSRHLRIRSNTVFSFFSPFNPLEVSYPCVALQRNLENESCF